MPKRQKRCVKLVTKFFFPGTRLSVYYRNCEVPMKTITSKIVTVCAVILLANLNSPQAQSNPGNLFNPPKWILGEWTNRASTKPENIERITFSSNEIEVVLALADAPTPLSRKYKKYTVNASTDADVYRVTISKDKEELIYEFKLCPKDQCYITTGDALSYSITKNKKVVHEHSTEMNNVLIRNAHP